MPSRVLDFVPGFVRRALESETPAPPAFERNVPGAHALFLDENEATVLYVLDWPYLGVPHDDRTNSPVWLIDGKYFTPARRDAQGNWIFRRLDQ